MVKDWGSAPVSLHKMSLIWAILGTFCILVRILRRTARILQAVGEVSNKPRLEHVQYRENNWRGRVGLVGPVMVGYQGNPDRLRGA